MNVKKVVNLCISIALLIVSLVFTVDGASVTAEFEAGKGEVITETTQLSDLIANLPSSGEYYTVDDATNENFKSVTMVEEGELEYPQAGYKLKRTLTIYFTEEGAYYQSKGIQTTRETTKDGTFETVLDFDAEIYITQGKVFIKYNKYETTVAAGVEIEEDEALMLSIIKRNYGKWIDLTYSGPAIDEENPDSYANMSEEEALKAMLIQETSALIIETFISINDSNVQQLQGLASFVGANSDKFEKAANTESYTLSDDYRDLLKAHMGGFTGRFNVNLTMPTSPRMHFDGSMMVGGETFATLKYTTVFKNIGSTKVNAPSSIKYNISNFLGAYFDKLINDQKGGN